MRHPKIAMIGAGSYVFSMGLLYDLIVEKKFPNSHLVLMDVNEKMVETMAGIARRMAKEQGVDMLIEATTSREVALRGADYVSTSVAVGIVKRYAMDRTVIEKYGLNEITSECGGVGGISYALRAIPLMLGIAKDMERLCPQAWLFNVSNPLPRVMTAITRNTSIRAAGFCNVANGGIDGYEQIGGWLGRNQHELDIVSGGLNHFSWLLSVRDKQSGEDLLPQVRQAIEKGAWSWNKLSTKWFEQYGWLPLAGDSHTGEFLPYDLSMPVQAHGGYHGNPGEREERIRMMEAAAEGSGPWQPLMQGRSWERPGLVIDALVNGTPLKLDMVNIVNKGYIPNLSEGAVVEVPAYVKDGQIQGVALQLLPDPVSELCAKVSAVHSMVADAAVKGDRAMVEEAVLLDPAIGDKKQALLAIRELMSIHEDVLPQFKSKEV
jgi:alpha-galactosidase/6-phospho-beta-glucosidase family protein